MEITEPFELLLGLLRSLELLQYGLAPVRHVDLDVAFLMTDNIVDAHLFRPSENNCFVFTIGEASVQRNVQGPFHV